MSDEDRRRLYALGHTDTPDRLVPARGVITGLALGAALLLGVLWPFGSWVAGGAW